MTNKLPWANKDLGQHFLRDSKVITAITEDFKDKAKAIVEVGPGPGIITEGLSKHELPFIVIEKDERFPEILKEYVSEDKIFLTDALKVNIEEKIKEEFSTDEVWLVSNLPYNVGTPLLINFLQAPSIKYMTLMFQREVADKVYAFDTRKGKAMGSLLALCQNYFDCDLLCKVPPGAFQPPPKVDSAVITMTRKENPEIPLSEFREFEKFLRTVFQFKRKQLGKVLKPFYDRERVEKCLVTLGLDKTVRAEALELEHIQGLYKLLKNKGES